MSSDDHVVVTGLGTIGACGVGVPPLLEQLDAGRPRTVDVVLSGGLHRSHGARKAALVDQIPIGDHVSPLISRRMSRPSQLAVVAARTALMSANVEVPPVADDGLGVVLSSAFGPSTTTWKLFEQIVQDDPRTASPMLFSECVANAPAAQVAIQCRARGPNLTVPHREDGGLTALRIAGGDLLKGRTRMALAGVAEEVTPVVHTSLDRFDALCTGESGEELPRPFDRHRNGALAAEGATILVLETAASAESRGARILARIRAWESAFDPFTSRTTWGREPRHLAESLQRFLARSAIDAGDIDRIVSGASGTQMGDRLEAVVLRTIWPEAMPPVLAPKGVTGEYGGGFLAAALLAAAGRVFGRMPACSAPDPDLNVRPHDGSALPAPRLTLVSSLSSAGYASWILLESDSTCSTP